MPDWTVEESGKPSARGDQNAPDANSTLAPPPEHPTPELGFFDRLRHHKVAQWTLAYAAGAYTLLHAVEMISGALGWPHMVVRLTTLVLLLGLPVAITLAWFHGHRARQRVGGLELAVLTVLFAISGGVLWVLGQPGGDPAHPSTGSEDARVLDAGVRSKGHASPPDAASIAVLPFVNMSSDPEQEYFSDGLSEEILNTLSRVPGLYVPARTSSFQFKGSQDDIRRIASLLGVASVLEGSVRKSGSRVRITAQLINAANGYHLWSQTYDRELKDIFAIQDEIADGIVDALKIYLTPAQRLAAAEPVGTSNPDAYESYLLGRYEAGKSTRESLASAIEHFRHAIELDPRFADAYANLALALVGEKTHPNAPFIGRKKLEDYVTTEVMPLLTKAQEIAPERAEVLAAAGFFADSEEETIDYYNRALVISPSNGGWLAARSGHAWRAGRFDKVLEASYESVKRDPASWGVLNGHAIYLLLFDRRAEVDAIVERETALNEVQGRGIQTMVLSYDGDRTQAIHQVLEIYDLLVGQSGDVGYGWRYAVAIKFAPLDLRNEVFNVTDAYMAHFLMGEFAEALPELRELYAETKSFAGMLAEAAYGAGRFEEAVTLYRELFAAYGPPTTNVDALLRAADAARRSGSSGEASGYRDRAARILDDATTAGISPRVTAFSYAMLHAYDGRDEAAAAALIRSLDTWHTFFWPYHPMQYRIPLVAHITERPDFQAALRKYQATLKRQRAEVVELLCGDGRVSKHYRPAPSTCAVRSSSG